LRCSVKCGQVLVSERLCVVYFSGSRSGYIHHHDVRVAQHLIGSLAAHQQEVCGLKWSPDGKYLASGGNDNLLNIWPSEPGVFHTSGTPACTFSQHQAAVKASLTRRHPTIYYTLCCNVVT